MSGWEGSDRRDRLPSDWPKLRATRLKIDGHRCCWRLPSGKRCPRPATDVDHRVAGDDHSMSNLQSLCGAHHLKKTAVDARKAKTARRNKGKRAPEKHPGEF